ncbi:hypothetical protein A5671_07730 [Mycolicibacter heraklionensis]|jgi:hypothetical protein|nr:hypothetical protein A5671_07730 [Mycolicibacter heraklionensis]
MSKVIPMKRKNEEPPAVVAPWSALGFATERDMLLDDLKALDQRIKSPSTTATAVAALSKRKQEVFEQIKALDSGDDEDDILDDADDESWPAG